MKQELDGADLVAVAARTRLGPHGVMYRAAWWFIVSSAILLGIHAVGRLYATEFYAQVRPFLRGLFPALPFTLFLGQLGIGLWGYLFRLANYVQVLRDYAVENIESLRPRVAEPGPQPERFELEPTAPKPSSSVPYPFDSTERQLGTKERNTMLKLIIGMAVKGYSHDPQASRSTAPKEIADDLAALGIAVSDDTVRKYLKEASDAVLPVKRRPG